MSTRIRLRRADHSNWDADNPTLDYGEVGLVYDTVGSTNTFVGFKIGDGSTAYDDLIMHRVPTSAGNTGKGLTADGTGTEGAGGSVTSWDEIALLARADQTFTGAVTVTGEVNFNGGLKCDTDGFVISADGLTTTIGGGSDGVLHIDNDSNADVLKVNTDKFLVQGDDGAVTTAGSVTATGAISTASTLTSTSTTDDDASGIAINTNKFRVNASNGDTLIAGTLGVTGNTTQTGTLAVGGAPALAKVWAPTDFAASYNSGSTGAGTEVEIGKWVDGTALYQRTIKTTGDIAYGGTVVTVSGMAVLTEVITHISVLKGNTATTTQTVVGPALGTKEDWDNDANFHLAYALFYQDSTAVKVGVAIQVDTNDRQNGILATNSILTVRYTKS